MEARAEDEGEYLGLLNPLFVEIRVLIAFDFIIDEDSVLVNHSAMSDA